LSVAGTPESRTPRRQRSLRTLLARAGVNVGLMRRYGGSVEIEIRSVNGWPALVAREGHVLLAVTQAHSDGDRIDALHA
jgi:hypothetical protein